MQKISEYTTERTTLINTDRFDVSADLGGGSWQTQYLSYGSLKTQLASFGFLQGGDDVSSLVNDANFVSSGANISVFTNDAGYITTDTSIYNGSGSLQPGATTVTFGATDTLTFATDALHIEANNGLQRVGINRTTFTRSGAFEVNGATTYNADALYTVSGVGIQIDGTNAVANSSLIFNRTVAGSNTNILFQELGVNIGAIQYDKFNNGTRDDGLKIYANGFGTDGESIYINGTTDDVVLPNGGLAINKTAQTPTAGTVLDVGGDTRVDGDSTLNGTVTIDSSSTSLKALTISSAINNTNNVLEVYSDSAGTNDLIQEQSASGAWKIWSSAAPTNRNLEWDSNGLIVSSTSALNTKLRLNIDGSSMFDVDRSGNVTIGTVTGAGGTRTIQIQNRTAAPTTPTGGGVLYVEGGALKYIGSSETVTTISNA
jgi:hypothetical protein